MSIVTVKNKYQVVIPQRVRRKVGIAVGDLLEAEVEKGKIVFTPKSIVDRAISEGLEDVRKGRVYGPFNTVDRMISSLKGKSLKVTKRKKS
ncbi:MAG: AbrB/MazE/SpoVT family DNA-binding domain-containing protein [Candidatus Doudnabacteria bacterium]|nr:AbrB/MazE/SpoVT family DNA-binding domain-containing protein [Candidatus Doudnabacteria bacterium]